MVLCTMMPIMLNTRNKPTYVLLRCQKFGDIPQVKIPLPIYQQIQQYINLLSYLYKIENIKNNKRTTCISIPLLLPKLAPQSVQTNLQIIQIGSQILAIYQYQQIRRNKREKLRTICFSIKLKIHRRERE